MACRHALFVTSTLTFRQRRAPHLRISTTPRHKHSRTAKATLETPKTLLHRIETDPALRVLDLRGRVAKPSGRVSSGFQSIEYIADDEAYNTNHIPTATFFDWRTIDVAKPHDLCDNLSSHGVTHHTPVVVYDWGDMLFATRAWFALKAMGLPDVAVLNGGWRAWERDDAPVDDHSPCPLTIHADMQSSYSEGETSRMTVSLEEMLALVGNHESLLVDARSEKQYRGIERRSKRAGRIPGAVNVPFRKLLRDDGAGLRSDEELRQILGSAKLLDRELVAYCNGGVASTLVLFCIFRCGVPLERLRNYCGSFGEWGNLDDTPIETGV